MNAKPSIYFVLGTLLIALAIGKLATCAASPSEIRGKAEYVPQAASSFTEAVELSKFYESPDVDELFRDATIDGDERRTLPCGRSFISVPSLSERIASCVRGRSPPSL